MNNKQKLMVGLLVVIALLSSVAYAGEKKVVVTLGKKEAVANGKKVSLDVPPQLVNGTLEHRQAIDALIAKGAVKQK